MNWCILSGLSFVWQGNDAGRKKRKQRKTWVTRGYDSGWHKRTGWTATVNANGGDGVSYESKGAELSQLGTGLKIWEQTELGWDTAMGWRNVTHAINELPVCLPKRWLRENGLGHRHLGRITNPLPPPLSAGPPRWVQSGWEAESSPETSLAPSHSPISSDTHGSAIYKLEACPLRSTRALQSSSRHWDYRLITSHSTAVEVKADFKYCQKWCWKEPEQYGSQSWKLYKVSQRWTATIQVPLTKMICTRSRATAFQ